MAPQTVAGSSIDAKWSDFDIFEVPYKHVNDTALLASVLVPHNIRPGKIPVIIHWHGGALVIGDRLFPDWYADWILAFGLKHNAIAITPDYRLLPEAKGVDILQDMHDFFAWLPAVKQLLPADLQLDLDNLLVLGESAGGWLAIQSGFARKQVAAVIAAYPMIDMRSPHYTEEYRKPLMNPPIPQMDKSVLENYISSLTVGEVATSRVPPTGLEFVACAFQTGLFGSIFGQEADLYPLEMLPLVNQYPPLWIFHGDADQMVPVDGTQKFADALTKTLPGTPFHFTIRPGEDHGFDAHDAATGSPATMDTEWVKQGLEFVAPFWPARVDM